VDYQLKSIAMKIKEKKLLQTRQRQLQCKQVKALDALAMLRRKQQVVMQGIE